MGLKETKILFLRFLSLYINNLLISFSTTEFSTIEQTTLQVLFVVANWLSYDRFTSFNTIQSYALCLTNRNYTFCSIQICETSQCLH